MARDVNGICAKTRALGCKFAPRLVFIKHAFEMNMGFRGPCHMDDAAPERGIIGMNQPFLTHLRGDGEVFGL